MILFIAIDLFMVLAEFVVGIYQRGTSESAVLEVITTGEYWFVFWIGEVVFAGVIPVLAVTLWRNSARAMGLAGVSMMIGILAVRLNLVIPAYVEPVLPGLADAYRDPRFGYEYLPSANEWLVAAGLVATIALIFSLALEFLPMGDRIRAIGRRG